MKSPTSHPTRTPIYRRIHYRFLRRNEHSSDEAEHEARSLVSNVLRRRNFVHSSFDEQKGKRRASEKRKMLKRGIEPQTFALLARRSNQLSYSSLSSSPLWPLRETHSPLSPSHAFLFLSSRFTQLKTDTPMSLPYYQAADVIQAFWERSASLKTLVYNSPCAKKVGALCALCEE